MTNETQEMPLAEIAQLTTPAVTLEEMVRHEDPMVRLLARTLLSAQTRLAIMEAEHRSLVGRMDVHMELPNSTEGDKRVPRRRRRWLKFLG